MQDTRLTYHFEAEKGWINDPNGLCQFGGVYHAFFQHNPYGPAWDTMHWGHATSTDLLHWQEQPLALCPDMPYENGDGCFSGSALEKDGVLYLMYTAVSKEHGQTQCIATSRDGLHFEKYAGNPVIPQSPLDPQSRDFRDPKIFRYAGDGYRMVCGAGVDGLASVLLYRSDDLLHWEYMGPLFQSRDYGPVPECPDLFPLGERWVLMFSRMDEGHKVQFIVGEFDGERFTPVSFQQPEQGPDFYAPQTFLDGKGRRLLIAWLHSWDRKPEPGAVRTGALTVPRQVTAVGDKLRTFPVEEARGLLEEDSPAIKRQDGRLIVTNGQKELLQMIEEEVWNTAVLSDGRTREVFLNGGEISCTFICE